MTPTEAQVMVERLLEDPPLTKLAFSMLAPGERQRLLDFFDVPTDTHKDLRVLGQNRIRRCWQQIGAVVACDFDRTIVYDPSDIERKTPLVFYEYDEAREHWYCKSSVLGGMITIGIYQLWEGTNK